MRPLALLAIPAALCAQSNSGPWKTITTAHYRIHYPDRETFPTFAREVASRIEGIHAQYLDLVGYRFEGVQDVLIGDPTGEANGSAWTFLKRPHLWLWTTPPETESFIGHHRGWEELLVVHELAHQHHLLRPQHRPRWYERWTDALGPLSEKAPRWIAEGYATLVEGRLTGSGRPHSLQRAAVLRTWAREGRLPAYGALNGSSGFLGGNMAYLAGSAYLEWLEDRAKDPKILPALWKHLASAKRRDFEPAFTATFGFSAGEGYARFSAELAHDALREEARLQSAGLVEGEVFAKVNGYADHLALSPDGTRLLARVRAPKQSGLWVWDLTAPEPKAAPKSQDPEEPDDAAPRMPSRPPQRRLKVLQGALARNPRWSADGKSILFDQPLADAEGRLRPHPRIWTPGQGVRPGSAPAAPADTAYRRGESDGAWNLVDAEGRPVTRTLSALWSPTQAGGKGPLFALRLTATGVEIRRFAEPPAPIPAAPAPAETLRTEGTVRRREDEPSRLPAPVAPPPAHSYREGETFRTFMVSGMHLGPSGSSYELGLGGNDFLGRLNGLVLGSFGDLRGGAAALRWEGWRVPVQLHAYGITEQPSRQRLRPMAGFDRERRGAELAADYLRQGPLPFRASLRGLLEREDMDGGPTRTRRLAELRTGLLWFRSAGEWSWQVGLGTGFALGETEGESWRRLQARVSYGLDSPWGALGLQASGGRVSGRPSPTDLFALGATATSLSPASADGFRLDQPGLPAFQATGTRYARLRTELRPGFGRFFVEHISVWTAPAPRPAALRIAGWDLDVADYGIPMDRIQGLVGRIGLKAGIYRILDGPLRHETTASVGLTVRP